MRLLPFEADTVPGAGLDARAAFRDVVPAAEPEYMLSGRRWLWPRRMEPDGG
jgi:hypothetical protein